MAGMNVQTHSEPAPGEGCPCKRIQCPRWGDCEACYHHHHLPGKKLPTTCERQEEKKSRKKKASQN